MNAIKPFTYRSDEGRKRQVQVVFQDKHLLAVNKPSQLPVIPDHWNPDAVNLKELLNQRLSRESGENRQLLWVVHRIDADTSGLVLFAKTEESHRLLNNMFREGQVGKSYLAVVQGIPPQQTGKINQSINTDRRKNGRVSIHPDGKPSETRYTVLEKFKHFALVDAAPLTGRTHQIRIHFQYNGFPLAVDPIYTGIEKITISDLKRRVNSKEGEKAPALISRLTLHARQLSFKHPMTGNHLKLEAEIPGDFNALLKALRKYDSVGPVRKNPVVKF